MCLCGPSEKQIQAHKKSDDYDTSENGCCCSYPKCSLVCKSGTHFALFLNGWAWVGPVIFWWGKNSLNVVQTAQNGGTKVIVETDLKDVLLDVIPFPDMLEHVGILSDVKNAVIATTANIGSQVKDAEKELGGVWGCAGAVLFLIFMVTVFQMCLMNCFLTRLANCKTVVGMWTKHSCLVSLWFWIAFFNVCFSLGVFINREFPGVLPDNVPTTPEAAQKAWEDGHKKATEELEKLSTEGRQLGSSEGHIGLDLYLPNSRYVLTEDGNDVRLPREDEAGLRNYNPFSSNHKEHEMFVRFGAGYLCKFVLWWWLMCAMCSPKKAYKRWNEYQDEKHADTMADLERGSAFQYQAMMAAAQAQAAAAAQGQQSVNYGAQQSVNYGATQQT